MATNGRTAARRCSIAPAARRGGAPREYRDVLADVEAMPLPDGAADVALLYNALRAVPHGV